MRKKIDKMTKTWKNKIFKNDVFQVYLSYLSLFFKNEFANSPYNSNTGKKN